MRRRSFINKLTSLMLAVVMVFSVVAVMPQDVSAAEQALGAKGGVVTITDDTCFAATRELTWARIKPNANGYLMLKFAGASTVVSYPYGYAQLYDGTKNKQLSQEFEYNTEYTGAEPVTEYYGVQKGKTYYIGIAAVGGVKVNVTFKKVKDKSGKNKKKALNIKKGNKGVAGIITAGTTASHWFKFKMPKPQKLTVNITPYLTGNLSVKITGPGSGNKASGTIRCRETNSATNKINPNYWGKKCQFINSKGTLIRSGTYYIQVKPTSRTSNGYYKISWK